jgi:hypothetical protein
MRPAPLLLPACIVTRHSVPMGDDGTVLAGTQIGGDAEVTWTLYPRAREGEPKLSRTTTRTGEVAYVGLTVQSMDAELAESRVSSPCAACR